MSFISTAFSIYYMRQCFVKFCLISCFVCQEKGAEIRVAVASNEKKKLSLDFTLDVMENAEVEKQREKADESVEEDKKVVEENAMGMSNEEAQAWAAYAAEDSDEYYEEEEYDEDRDIEDRLGIGFY